MKVLVAGANGKTGRQIVRLLAERGHEVRSMVRDEAQVPGQRDLGAEPVLADLEGEVRHTAEGCDAVIFAAGGGPGSGAAKKETVDRGGAEKLVEAAEAHGVRRYLMLSSQGVQAPEEGPEKMQPYLSAKARADERLLQSSLDYTIIRPGSLTNDPGTGHVTVNTELGERGEVSREDVALTFAVALDLPNTYHKTFELFSGETPVERALASI
ncbi:MAG: SDR family oxidoreductase [Rubrobacter sp.]|nr:SDR family oxidoreductase [Rubrobacter sp.]